MAAQNVAAVAAQQKQRVEAQRGGDPVTLDGLRELARTLMADPGTYRFRTLRLHNFRPESEDEHGRLRPTDAQLARQHHMTVVRLGHADLQALEDMALERLQEEYFDVVLLSRPLCEEALRMAPAAAAPAPGLAHPAVPSSQPPVPAPHPIQDHLRELEGAWSFVTRALDYAKNPRLQLCLEPADPRAAFDALVAGLEEDGARYAAHVRTCEPRRHAIAARQGWEWAAMQQAEAYEAEACRAGAFQDTVLHARGALLEVCSLRRPPPAAVADALALVPAPPQYRLSARARRAVADAARDCLTGREPAASPIHVCAGRGSFEALKALVAASPAAVVRACAAGCRTTPFHEAARGGQAMHLRFLLQVRLREDGGQPEALRFRDCLDAFTRSEGRLWRTVLMLACEADAGDCVEVLLEFGAAPWLRTPHRQTALHLAAAAGAAAAVAALLGAEGAEPQQREEDAFGKFPCEYAATPQVRALLPPQPRGVDALVANAERYAAAQLLISSG